ncbi:MAG: hypothetical protein KA807_15245 [Prolixibacteraceae bacterium]|nr:hypothetical protein [Prolixibacteraceae bacterium]
MKKIIALLILLPGFMISTLYAQITAPGVKWNDTYTFDKYNELKVDFYSKKNELMQSLNYKSYYQSNGKDFAVKMIAKSKNNNIETVFDLKNEVAIQIFGEDQMYNAGGFKYPTEQDKKLLEIIPAEGTKTIAGLVCKRYTYTFKKITGEVWITDQCKLSNDYGIFRAAKMAAKHNTLSVGGFVMEMTTEDSTGAKTVMTTVSLKNNCNYSVSFKNVDMNTAINKINYYTF